MIDEAQLDAIEARAANWFLAWGPETASADLRTLCAALRAAWRERDLVMDETAGLEVEVERLRDAWRLADADRYRVYRERDQAIAERDAALRQRDEARAVLALLVKATFPAKEPLLSDDYVITRGMTPDGPFVFTAGDWRAAVALLSRYDDAAPGAARPPEAGA